MAVITSSKLIILVLGYFYLITMVSCRPQNAIDSQDSPDDNGFDMRQRLFNAYQNYPSPLSPEERMALNRMQYELMANYVQNSMPAGTFADPIYRSPEIKRQVRYRQCYFNPISCFRK